MSADDALKVFLEVPDNAFLSNEIEIKSGEDSFTAPTNISNGKMVIQAKSSSTKYTGELTIAITTSTKGLTDLALVITTTAINGTEDMKDTDALDALSSAISWSNLKDFVTIKSFDAPNKSEQKNGQLVLEAKEGTNYFGSVTITINY